MANETALERILRVLDESDQIEPSFKAGLKEGLFLLEASPTVPGIQAIVEKSALK
jgi:hypothetical protein